MLGDDDIGVLIDEPVTAADLFGEDEDETPALDIPPLSPNPDADENAAPAADGSDAAQVKKRRQLNRLPNLNEKWITDPTKAGMHAVNKYFENIKLKRGKGNEFDNVKMILKRYEYWAQHCYPKLCFKDFVDKVEALSHKKLVKNVLQELRCNRSSGNNDDNNDDDNDNNANDGNDAGNDIQLPTIVDSTDTLASPASQPNTSFASPQLNTSITDEQRDLIRRKREEAIAKRKRKFEESMNLSNVSSSQGNNDVSSILDSSVVSTPDETSQPLNSTHSSISQIEMEMNQGDDLMQNIRRKKVEAFLNDQYDDTLDESSDKTVPVEEFEPDEIQNENSPSSMASECEPIVDILEHHPAVMSETSDERSRNVSGDPVMTGILSAKKITDENDTNMDIDKVENTKENDNEIDEE